MGLGTQQFHVAQHALSLKSYWSISLPYLLVKTQTVVAEVKEQKRFSSIKF